MTNISKTCRVSGKEFVITDEDQAFYEKMEVPLPTLCPEERMRRRLAFRNERYLYHRKCDLSGKELITIFPPENIHKVYDQKEWWGDKWDPLEYGRDFNFNRPFFDQLKELFDVVPLPHVMSSIDIAESNCIYTNYAGDNKNCYLIFDSDFNEDCLYGNVNKHSKSCMDCSYINKSELLYECLNCQSCYNLKYSQDCTNCFDSNFIKNCVGCKNCFACTGLVQKEYCIFNIQYGKEEYLKKIEEYKLGNRTFVNEFKKKFHEFSLNYPYKYFHGVQIENSDGDYINNTQNVSESFDVGNSRDLKYCDSLYTANDCMDVSSFGEKIERVYESGTIGLNATNIKFSHGVVNNCYNIDYSIFCRGSNDLFGCVGIKRASYVILNKQYSKEEYESLKKKIIEHMKNTGEWGEFFPAHLSPHGYNETMAQEYFPMSKEEAKIQNFNWYEDNKVNSFSGSKVELPEDIEKTDKSITQQILSCASCKKNYKITNFELNFYFSNKIPAPELCFECRHKLRFSLKNPRALWDRQCQKCSAAVKTSYAPNRPEKVYCEACYLAEVY